MGQKVNPIGFRIALNKQWQSRWFAKKQDFGLNLAEDNKIRETVRKAIEGAAITKIAIERYANRVRVIIFTARPGVIVGNKGQEVEKLKARLAKSTGKEIYLDIQEVRTPDADAQQFWTWATGFRCIYPVSWSCCCGVCHVSGRSGRRGNRSCHSGG